MSANTVVLGSSVKRSLSRVLIAPALLLASMLLLSGCFAVETSYVVNEDGSGSQTLRLATGRPTWPVVQVPGVDVEVQPVDVLIDKMIQKQGRCQAAAEASLGGIGQIGNGRLDQTAIRRVQRHVPERVLKFQAEVLYTARRGRVARIDRRQIFTQGDSGSAGQGGKVNDALRSFLTGQSQRISQHQATFGVGIADFNA